MVPAAHRIRPHPLNESEGILDQDHDRTRRDPSPTSRAPGATRAVSGWARLTAAERTVAELVAAGLTNRTVAVDFHLRRSSESSAFRRASN